MWHSLQKLSAGTYNDRLLHWQLAAQSKQHQQGLLAFPCRCFKQDSGVVNQSEGRQVPGLVTINRGTARSPPGGLDPRGVH